MNRIENRSEELVELGVASIETKGLPVQALIDSKGDHVAGGMSHD